MTKKPRSGSKRSFSPQEKRSAGPEAPRLAAGRLTLPLLPEVGAALWDYLRQDRTPGIQHRRVFVTLAWPHRPLRSAAVSVPVTEALHKAGLHGARPKDLRATVATHLLRQGEALSSIQEVLGHRTAETTQRYALTDVVLLRQLLEESER